MKTEKLVQYLNSALQMIRWLHLQKIYKWLMKCVNSIEKRTFEAEQCSWSTKKKKNTAVITGYQISQKSLWPVSSEHRKLHFWVLVAWQLICTYRNKKLNLLISNESIYHHLWSLITLDWLKVRKTCLNLLVNSGLLLLSKWPEF